MLELTDIKVYHQQKCTLDIEHLTIQENQLTVILGHNGSGKSTLMKLLAREIVAKQGDVKLNNKNVNNYSHRDFAKQVAYLPQRLPQVAGLTVSELVRLGRFPWRGILGRWQAEDKHIIEQAMQQTDVLHYASHFADSLSGGERQRAWIAMLLAQQSPIFLPDYP